MDQHKRMTKTLACLVASMTVGAAFLNWMKPDSLPGTSSGIELIARGAASRTWQGIRVNSAAIEPRHRSQESHFLIDREGLTIQTSSWKTQQALDTDLVVRISLLASVKDQGVTRAQRSTAQELVRSLQLEYGIPSGQVIWDKSLRSFSRETSHHGAGPFQIAAQTFGR